MKARGVIWPNLPVLAVGSVLVTIAWAFAWLIPRDARWAALVVVGLLVLPLFAALLRGCEVLLVGDHFGVWTLLHGLPGNLIRAVRITAPVLAVVLLSNAGIYAWQVSGSAWLLPSAVLGGVLALASAYVGVVALPYYVAERGSWTQAWLVAVYIATRNPVPVLAALAGVVLGVLATAHLSLALILLLPAPVALVWASAIRTATAHSQDLLHAKEPVRDE
jgi:hypothetical protein